MKTIKKYSNRRLYDTDQSAYITLEELARLIREGHDVEVVDAKSDRDLTQATLAQIVVESRGAARLLPVPLLTQMIRMEEDALAEFMSLYMSWALDVYVQAKKGFTDMNPYQMLGAGLPFDPRQALGRLFGRRAPWNRDDAPDRDRQQAPEAGDERPPEPPPVDDVPPGDGDDLAMLRREIQRLNERIEGLEDGESDSEA